MPPECRPLLSQKPCFYATILLLLSMSAYIRAANLPNGFFETQLAKGFSSPIAMAIAPDGRIFVIEQWGRIRVVKNGKLLSTPFVAINVDSSGERGLLGIALDPNFAA